MLRAGQYSLRKLRLRTLIDTAPATRDRLGPFANIEQAWTVLVEAERRDQDTVEDVLMTPSIGVWLGRALRQALGRPPDSTPPQVDIGWFHAVAAAAAVRCGVSCALPVPIVHGAAFLPSVGVFRLPTSFPTGHAEVAVTSTTVSVTACGGTVACTEPEPVRHHRSTAHGAALTATIEVSDPYRAFGAPEPAGHLDEVVHATWTKQLDEAWELLTRWHPAQAEELSAGLATLVPLPAELGVFAASSSAAFGSIAMSPKRSATECAEALVHELQHSKLNALFDLVDLCAPGGRSELYAPWRDEPRPLSGMLHGIYAFVSVVEFWHQQRRLVPAADTRRAEFAIGYRANQLDRVLDAVGAHPDLTDLGREFVASVAARLAAHLPVDVSPDIAAVVEELTADHYAIWRMRHVRPDPRTIANLADNWLAGQTAGTTDWRGSVVLPRPSRPSVRAALLKVRTLEPHRFERLPQDGPDAAYARGERDTATAGYLHRIEAVPSDVTAWAGLGLTTRSPALLHIPEMVRATYHRVAASAAAAPNPLDVAAWFDRAGPPTAKDSLRRLLPDQTHDSAGAD